MKKIMKILSLVLCLVLALSFVACSKEEGSKDDDNNSKTTEEKPFVPDSATAIWNKIDETMNGLESYKTAGLGKAVMFLSSYKVDTTISQSGVYSKVGDNYAYETMTMKMVCDKLGLNETMEQIEAYYGGKMYVAKKDSKIEQKLCSVISFDEYKETKGDAALDKINITDCTTSEFKKNDDGTWSLKFSGYTKKTMNTFLEGLNVDDAEGFGAEVVDFNINVTADSQYRAIKVALNLEFGTPNNPSTVPSFELVCDYFDYNNASPNPEAIKTDEYTEVYDLRVLEKVDDAIEAEEASKLGSFTLEINQSLKSGKDESKAFEKDTVKYGERNGKFYYEIVSEANNGKVTVSYENGTQKYSNGTDIQSYSQTEDEAKEVISELFVIVAFDSGSVIGIEKLRDGVYKFTFTESPRVNEFKEYFKDSGINFNSATQETTVTMNDAVVSKIETKINAKGTYNSQAVTMDYDLVMNFN